MVSYDCYAAFSTVSWKKVHKIVDLLTLRTLRTRAQSEHFEHSNRYRVDSYFVVVVVATAKKGLRLIYLTSKWAETLFPLWHYKIIISNVLQSSDRKIHVCNKCSKGIGDESLDDKHVTKHPIVIQIVLANFPYELLQWPIVTKITFPFQPVLVVPNHAGFPDHYPYPPFLRQFYKSTWI